MSRTIELGRAVLDSSSAKLQLWLTTLITISPERDSTNVQHLNTQALLDLLLSGNVWVGRGNGMHMVLELTANGDPIGSKDLQVLAEQIINAPVWSQVNLCPSLPRGESGITLPFDHGKLHINIKHAHKDTETKDKKCRRNFSNLPYKDASPPEGVPNIGLMSVRFAMEVIKLQRYTKQTRPKRRRKLEHADVLGVDLKEVEVADLKKPPAPLEDTDNMNEHEMLWTDLEGDAALCHTAVQNPSRQEQPTTVPRMGTCPGTPLSVSLHDVKNGKRPLTESSPEKILAKSHHSPIPRLETLVDAAIRLTMCSILPKPATGIKVKANTFAGSLIDVAPALWSPGYLPEFSQRSHFLPIITRSLGRAGGERAWSLSLQDKIAQLTIQSSGDVSKPAHKDPHSNYVDKSTVKSLSARLWMYTYRNLTVKTTNGPLLGFCATDSYSPTPSYSPEDMLDNISTQVELRVHSSPQINSLENTGNEHHRAISTSIISPHLQDYEQSSINDSPLATTGTRCETSALPVAQEDDDLLLIPQATAARLTGPQVDESFSANLVGPTHEFTQGASEYQLCPAKEDLHGNLLLEDRTSQFRGNRESIMQHLWTIEDVGRTAAKEDMLLTF